MSGAAYRSIEGESRSSHEKRLETGGFLLCRRVGRRILVEAVTGPGPNAVRTPVHFEPDYLHTAREFKRLARGRRLFIGGGWHLHGLHELSSGDRCTLDGVSQDQPGFLALIAYFDGAELQIRVFTLSDGHQVEIPWRLRPEKPASANVLQFARSEQLIPASGLLNKRVVLVGCGSGGCKAAVLLAQAGVARFDLIDAERLEPVNLIRHEGKYHQLGMNKVDIAQLEILSVNPSAQVAKHCLNVGSETIGYFTEIVRSAHLVLACSGDPRVNLRIDKACRELRKPVCYGGVFEKASGGFAMAHVPYHKHSPCFNCVYDFSGLAQMDSNEHLRDSARRYGVSDEELSAHQGLYIDISFVTHLFAKMALMTLLRGLPHELGTLPGNLVVWNSRTMETKWVRMRKREDCAVCGTAGISQLTVGHSATETTASRLLLAK